MKRLFGVILAAVMLFTVFFVASGEDGGELLLGYDSLSGQLLPDSVVSVGQRYDFPVFVSANGAVMPLSDELMKKYSFKIANLSGGESVGDFSFSKRNGYYYITVLADKSGEYRYSLTLVERASGLDTLSLPVEFSAAEQTAHTVKNPPTGIITAYDI